MRKTPPTAAPPAPQQFYTSVGNSENIAPMNQFAEECGVIFRSNASLWGQDYSNLTTNLSGRPGLERRHYEQFRPSERLPVKHKEIVSFAEKIYQKVGLIRNIIDLMGDFAGQGIRVSCANKRDERFYRNWFAKAKGPDRTERFLNNLYRTGNIIILRQTAKIDLKLRSKFFRANGKVDIKPEKENIVKNIIPLEYVFLNPVTIDIVAENVACLARKKQYYMTLPTGLKQKITARVTKKEEQEVYDSLPEPVKKAIENGGIYILPEDKTLVFHYKKDDWLPWAYPMTYSIFDDIILLEKHKLADSTALDGAISNIRIFKLGHISSDGKSDILPGPAQAVKLREILSAHTAGGTIDIVWGPDIELVESKTDVHKFLGKAKYEPTLDAIYGGIGIPSTLVGSGEGGTTNNFISLKTLIQRLEYGRQVLVEFWTKELEIVQKAMGLEPAVIEFDYMDLGDPASHDALLIQLSDRGLMSDELIQHKFKHNPALEDARIKRENEERNSNQRAPKAGPFFDGEQIAGLKKIALQKGYVKPQDVGVSLKEVGETVRDKTKPKPVNKTKTGVSGQGRPKNSKDTVKRKTKTFTPRTKASFEIWASNAQEKITEVLTPMFLQTFGKKNMRSLTDKEAQIAEKMKFGVLFNIEPFKELSKDNIGQAFKQVSEFPDDAYAMYKGLCDDTRTDLGRNLTFEEARHIQRYLYGEIYDESDS